MCLEKGSGSYICMIIICILKRRVRVVISLSKVERDILFGFKIVLRLVNLGSGFNLVEIILKIALIITQFYF